MAGTTAFVGSVPENYHRYLGPLLFEPYARDIAARLKAPPGARLLEVACGTGIVTKAALAALPHDAAIIATDLNEAMVDVARRHVASDRVTFRVADAQTLPFDDGSFDILFCQFGVMFFPDKPRAMREARRVLARPSSRLIFNVWDALEHNPISALVHDTLATLFPDNPPDFYKTPFGWHDPALIEHVLREAGFTRVAMNPVTFPCTAPTADDAARGLVEGSPVSGQLKDRGASDLSAVRGDVAEVLARTHGREPCASTMRALVVEAS